MSQQVAETTARVSEFLEEFAVTKASENTFVARRGSAVVGIRVLPWDESDETTDEAMVEVRANVVEGAKLSVVLLRQLMEFNDEAAYGAFGVSEDGSLITYHHCLLGRSLSKRELLEVVHEVAQVADDWDDVIVEEAGGKTAVDSMRERRKTLRPTIERPGEA